MTPGAPRRNDDCIYTPGAIFVGLILYPPRVCSGCGMELPANTDYFTQNKQSCDGSGLTYNCRRCRRAVGRESRRNRRKARVET